MYDINQSSVGEPPVVSVLMLTHSHGSFLHKAISSVQAQSFQSWELLIGEDGSSDNTAIIARQAANSDSRIHIFSSLSQPVGFHHNFARLLSVARAPYIAFLEGDDWWHETRKLEMQVAMLQADVSLAFCGGYTRVLDQRYCQSKRLGNIGPSPHSYRLVFSDFIDSYSFHFSSVVMRRHAVKLPAWIFSQYCLDRPLYLLAALQGDGGIIHAELSTYRLHSNGVWASLSPLQRACRSRELFGSFYTHFPQRYCHQLHLSLSNILWGYLVEAISLRLRWQTFLILLMGIEAAPIFRLLRNPRPTFGSFWRVIRLTPVSAI